MKPIAFALACLVFATGCDQDRPYEMMLEDEFVDSCNTHFDGVPAENVESFCDCFYAEARKRYSPRELVDMMNGRPGPTASDLEAETRSCAVANR